MAVSEPETEKKYFTHEEACKMLPLVKAIIQDITTLANTMRDRYAPLANPDELPPLHREELEDQYEVDQERLQNYVDELTKLGVELKDPFIGLIDFPCWKEGREVYLCWKQGEESITHWHETWAGFAGRQKIKK